MAQWRSTRVPRELSSIGPLVRDRRTVRWRVPPLAAAGQDDLVSLAVNAEDTVAVLLPEVGDVRAGSLKDPQPQQPEHREKGEVMLVG